MLTRARSGRVIQRRHNKKSQIEDVTRDVSDVMHRKRARRILGELRKVSELSSWLGRTWFTFASSPKPGQWPRGVCAREGGQMENSA